MVKKITLTIEFDKTSDGHIMSRVQLETPTNATWYDYVHGGATPLQAAHKALKRIDEATSMSKRGRKPNGFKSVHFLKFPL